MRQQRLFWQIFFTFFPSFLLLITFFGWYQFREFQNTYYKQVESDLVSTGSLVALQAGRLLAADKTARLQELLAYTPQISAIELVIISPSGRLVASSHSAAQDLDFLIFPEVRFALAGRQHTARHYAGEGIWETTHAAVPILHKNKVLGAVRASAPLRDTPSAARIFYRALIVAASAAALITGLAAFLLFNSLVRPLRRIKQTAVQLAEGRLGKKVAEIGPHEIAAVAAELNVMSAKLRQRFEQEARQRSQLDTVLESLVEGVIAVDTQERIININRAAIELLGVNLSDTRGRPIQEVVRDSTLQRIISGILAEQRQPQTIAVLHKNNERVFDVRANSLTGSDGNTIGALVVLHDVTQIKRLEEIRRDFVSNVSHELRTPITSIKGFIETLLDTDLSDREQTQRFLEIVMRQANRLDAIIQDLLSLSRIEEQAGRVSIDMQPCSVAEILHSAVEISKLAAERKGIKLIRACPEELPALMNPNLLEQAVVNLIDNAVKYSNKNTEVQITAGEQDGRIVIAVTDQGSGIEAKHFDRLFERFYRVDKARSRELGGTGLGLSIVKHICQLHGGYARVESTVGTGSTFSIYIRKAVV